MANETTTIEISVENWQWLSSLKQRPGDSFNDVLDRLREHSTPTTITPDDVIDDDLDDGRLTTDWSRAERFSDTENNEIGPEGMTMDAGEALFGDLDDDHDQEIKPAGVPDDLNLPGSGDTYEQRRQAIGKLYAYLQMEETATRSDFLELVDPDVVGYASADSFWSNAVKGRDSLSSLEGVVPPSEGGHTWRYDP